MTIFCDNPFPKRKNVIDQSMTVCKGAGCTMVSAIVTAKTVIDQSMTLCKGAGCTMVSAQIVIDRSMTIFEDPSENCH